MTAIGEIGLVNIAARIAYPGVKTLYAARVSGSTALAARKPALLRALARHLFLGEQRMAALAGAL